ncbi:hypothetical protein Ancab_016689 [Ancistrocladus abbreviatus]
MGKDGAADRSLYPLHRCKILHLVRHAQGIHNLEEMANSKTSPELFDAKLSPLGWNQVDNLRQHVNACGLSKSIELVITSPLLRTMQTAAGVFGCQNLTDGTDVTPLMVADVNSGQEAISSLNCPPFIVVELCRERLGVNTCDKRGSISEYKKIFPAIDFSLIESDDDNLWMPDVRESDEDLAARGMKFMSWLRTRKEKEIAVVTHSAFLFHTLREFGNRCHPSMKTEICKFFANCELRSMVLVDESMMGSESATTDYPGGIPRGVDMPNSAGKGN